MGSDPNQPQDAAGTAPAPDVPPDLPAPVAEPAEPPAPPVTEAEVPPAPDSPPTPAPDGVPIVSEPPAVEPPAEPQAAPSDAETTITIPPAKPVVEVDEATPPPLPPAGFPPTPPPAGPPSGGGSQGTAPPPNPRTGAKLLGIAPAIVGLATLVTLAIFLFPDKYITHHAWWDKWFNTLAVVAGIVVAALFAALFVYLRHDLATPEHTNPRLFGPLSERWTALDARVRTMCEPPPPPADGEPSRSVSAQLACAEASAQRDYVMQDLALPEARSRAATTAQPWPSSGSAKWVVGSGYVDTWERLHRADEALFAVVPVEDVIQLALIDEMRLTDSNIDNKGELLRKLRLAVAALGGAAYLTASPAIPAPPDFTPEQRNDPAAQLQARMALRDVRFTINQFRDNRRAGLVRSRNQLAWTGLITETVAYIALAFAVLTRADRGVIVAAVAFFLMGAIIGLFDQLRLTIGSDSAAEDFGLGRARLVHTPALSGLAGVGGVLITALLFTTLNGNVIRYPSCALFFNPTSTSTATAASTATTTPMPGTHANASPGTIDLTATATATASATASTAATTSPTVSPTATGGAATVTPPASAAATGCQQLDNSGNKVDPPKLSAIFDLDINRFGFILAAIFGLAPGLLVERLQSEVKRYQSDLQSTNP
jgi:hypothetical protein